MKKGISINIVLEEEHNRILERSKKESGRTKRQEAAKRLADHLERFGDRWEKPIDEPKA
ncbi:TraY domain-containing protein [Vibrio cincinnatiensis]|uniref:TraY domain-containing protein n=1 Tax=Vibrio cincinnatiensis TaxID=675 RepID=UPI001EDD8BC6|nr:TraY domain-containing protein [Vibrio cincinnatiensis]MCG3741156.1 TraY domain-containing protein [Vibrio cincinnatiensis]